MDSYEGDALIGRENAFVSGAPQKCGREAALAVVSLRVALNPFLLDMSFIAL
jgi:hypothetical protein